MLAVTTIAGPSKVHVCDRCADTGVVTALLRESPEHEYSFRCDLCFRAPEGLSWPLWDEHRHAAKFRRVTGAEMAEASGIVNLKDGLRKLLAADRQPRNRLPD